MNALYRVFSSTIIVFIVAIGAIGAETGQLAAWLQALSAMEHPSTLQVSSVRDEIEHWIALHPGPGIDLPEPPPMPWSDGEIHNQVAVLKGALEKLIRDDPSHPFALGVTIVNVSASAPTLSPVTNTIDQADIENLDALRVKDAIDYLPGVSIDDKAPRSQSGISIGGFDTRQVPLYLDGLPLYVPFDGYVDLGRYLTSDIAEVQVAKGYSSPLLGPNLLGGVINLVSREPRNRIEGDAFIGTASGNMLNSGLHLGSRWRRFFFQGSLDWLQSDFYPLSGNFSPNLQQPGDRRVNSYQRDERFSGRAAWTPMSQDQYVFSYYNQKGTEGDPPYSGSAPVCPSGNANVTYACVTPKYWKWPFWNTDSYYFSSNTQIGEVSSVKFRGFYNQFPNSLQMFDDATYSTMYKSASSGALNYDDHSIGASGEFGTRLAPRNAIGASFFIKDDAHRERATTFSAKDIPSTTPRQEDRDRQSSFGIQDVITVSRSLSEYSRITQFGHNIL